MSSLIDTIREMEKENKSNNKDPIHVDIVDLSNRFEKPINEVEKEIEELLEAGFVIKINTLNNFAIKTNEL